MCKHCHKKWSVLDTWGKAQTAKVKRKRAYRYRYLLTTNQQHLLYHVDQQMIKQLQLFPIN